MTTLKLEWATCRMAEDLERGIRVVVSLQTEPEGFQWDAWDDATGDYLSGGTDYETSDEAEAAAQAWIDEWAD